MKINKKIKIWEAVQKDDLRPAMGYICFRDGYAYATNGRILVRIPIPELFADDNYPIDGERLKEMLNGVLFHAALWKKMAGFNNITITKENELPVLKVVEEFQEITFAFIKDRDRFTFPKGVDELFNLEPKEPVSRIAFSVEEFNRLTAAMGVRDITLNFTNEKEKVLAAPENPYITEVRGIIMPKMIND